VFLHYQEKALAKKGGDRWLDSVFTPNPQDKMVITFRQWLNKRAGEAIAWDKSCSHSLPEPERDKAQLFDVWNTHTKDCSLCQNALRKIQRLEILAYSIAVFSFGIGIMLDARAIAAKTVMLDTEATTTALQSMIPTTGLLWAILGSSLFGMLGYLLKRFSRLFYVYEFNHAKND
jgi:phenylpropionate dioxygenase-like ring-hydroxylating dioxygenase large terminal subunit